MRFKIVIMLSPQNIVDNISKCISMALPKACMKMKLQTVKNVIINKVRRDESRCCVRTSIG